MPPAGHDGDDRPRLPALPRHQAHLPQPGPRPVRQPRDEPLHPVLPLRALLSRLRRRARFRCLRAARQRLLRPRTRTACSKASSAATWSRSARPASSPTRRSSSTTRASGTCRRRRRSACTAASAATRSPASATACCGASATATTARSTATSSATVAATATSSSTASGALRQRLLRPRRGAALRGDGRGERAAARWPLLCGGARKLIGIGSPRASLEANFALRTLGRRRSLLPRRRRARAPRCWRSVLDDPAATGRRARRRCTTSSSRRRRAGARRRRRPTRAPMLALALRQSVRRQPHARSPRSCRSRAGTTTRCARRCRSSEGPALHRQRRARRGSTTSRRAPGTPRPTTWRGSASPSRMRSMPRRPAVDGLAGRDRGARRHDRRGA